ncbi:uncharacterized protein LOC124262215 [Haliotis rubra]|uniref:uncharacterized protein LOC124262215 n=1 Tax=Haliotis rubra TaxID=36100 RepID=UPI001EE62D36|nr:uncharacterized protein LOC124262215 [Haliotis rubra]
MSGSSTDPELYKLIDLNRKSDTSDEEFNSRPSCRLDKMDSSLQEHIGGPSPSLMESQQSPVKMIGASHKPKEVKRSKISSKVSSGKSSSSTEDSMSSDSRRSKAKLGRIISKKDTPGLGKAPSMSKRRDISDSKLPIQLGAHPVVLNPIGSSSATPTDVHTLKGHKKGTLSQASAKYQVARRLDFSPPTASSSDVSSPSEEPDKLQHRKVPRKRAPTAIFSESPSSSDSFEQQIEILQGPTTPLSRPPSATELQVPSTLCISGAVSVIGYEKETDLREREAEISTSSLPAPLPTPDLLAPSPFMRRTGQPLPPVMGKSSSSCQEPQVTPELPTKKQVKMKQDSLTLMGAKVKRPKPTKDVWFKQDETEPKDMRFTPDQRATKEAQFKHDQTDTKEVRFQLEPTTSKEFRMKEHSLSNKDITVKMIHLPTKK